MWVYCIAGGTVVVDADNVIIRYMRFRLGDLNTGGNLSDGSDTIWGRYHKDIILDHCSMSWSIDECASFYANQNFTMQWCILSESLRRSLHDKGSHGYGGIWGGRNASFHHNLLASHDSRNPRFDHPLLYLPNVALDDFRGVVDFRNNVIYNWGSNSTYGGEGGRFNMVANYYKPGPATPEKGTAAFITANPSQPLEAAAAAVCAMGLAGEIAHARLTPLDGNATYRNYIIDAIYHMTPAQLEEDAKYEVR